MEVKEEKSLREIAEGIAAALGPEWKRSTAFDEEDAQDRRPWRSRIEGPNKLRLFLSNTWGPKGMLHVSGWVPDEVDRNAVRVSPMASINTSLGKTPEQMAKDIERRLLPEYRTQIAEILKAHEADLAYKKAMLETKERVAEILGGEAREDREIVYGSGRADIQVCGPDSLRFSGHCFYMTCEQLAKIRAAVPELFERERASEVA